MMYTMDNDIRTAQLAIVNKAQIKTSLLMLYYLEECDKITKYRLL